MIGKIVFLLSMIGLFGFLIQSGALDTAINDLSTAMAGVNIGTNSVNKALNGGGQQSVKGILKKTREGSQSFTLQDESTGERININTNPAQEKQLENLLYSSLSTTKIVVIKGSVGSCLGESLEMCIKNIESINLVETKSYGQRAVII